MQTELAAGPAAPAGARPRPLNLVKQWRDRLLASPRFQNWAAAFPLTRRIARRDARALFDICAGFVYAQVLRVCVELDLFEQLAAGPLGVSLLARRAGLPDDAMRLVLNAAVSLRLLETAGDESFRLGRLGAALRGNPGVVAIVQHHRLFYDDLADPLALLRGKADTRLGQFWPYRGGPGDVAGYSELMAKSQPFITQEIFRRYDFSRHRTVLDLGGGDGSFLAALAAQAPKLRLQLFDLPRVAARAQARLAAAGRPDAEIHEGSFFGTPFPEDADLITLIRVLHDHDDAAALTILRSAHRALPRGGTLLIAEPMAGSRHAEPVGAAYFSFYLLATGGGRPRRAAEVLALLRRAGFTDARDIPTRQPILTSLIIAQKL